MKQIIFSLILVTGIISCSPKLSPDKDWGNNKKWVLFELNNTPVQLSGTNKDAHMVFIPAEKSFSGTGGCNRISGIYQITKKDRIAFNNIAGTMMSCPDLTFEQKVLETLRNIDHFAINNNEMFLMKGNVIMMKYK